MMSDCNLSDLEKNQKTHSLKYFTMNYLAKANPEWVMSDGSCPRCEDFYENELDSIVQVVSYSGPF